jgi:hypothetical protein
MALPVMAQPATCKLKSSLTCWQKVKVNKIELITQESK